MGIFSRLFGGKRDEPAPAPSPANPIPPASSAEEDDWQGLGVPQELNVNEAEAMLKEAEPPVFLDVREDHERQASGFIPGSQHIPMGDLETRHGELDPQKPVIVYCASGMRSMDAGAFLIEKGFRDVSNLNGGMNNWQGPVEKME